MPAGVGIEAAARDPDQHALPLTDSLRRSARSSTASPLEDGGRPGKKISVHLHWRSSVCRRLTFFASSGRRRLVAVTRTLAGSLRQLPLPVLIIVDTPL